MPMKKPVSKWRRLKEVTEQIVWRLCAADVFISLGTGDKRLARQDSYAIRPK